MYRSTQLTHYKLRISKILRFCKEISNCEKISSNSICYSRHSKQCHQPGKLYNRPIQLGTISDSRSSTRTIEFVDLLSKLSPNSRRSCSYCMAKIFQIHSILIRPAVPSFLFLIAIRDARERSCAADEKGIEVGALIRPRELCGSVVFRVCLTWRMRG